MCSKLALGIPRAPWLGAPAQLCPVSLTSRQQICLPSAPNYPGWQWLLAHLSLNQALPLVLSQAV